jgi:hypothetical protein
MNAQERFKKFYRLSRVAEAEEYLYAAALERIVARQQREIEAQAQLARELRSTLIVICEEYDSDSTWETSARRMYKYASAGIKNADNR